MTLPSDILTRSADEAVRRIAIHLLEQARAAGARVLDDAPHAARAATELRAALRSLELHLRLIGERFGVRAEDGGVFALARDENAHDDPTLARASITFAERAVAPLRTLSVELDTERRAPTYGIALAGVLRRVAAELVAALEDFDAAGGADDADEVYRAALSASDLLGPMSRSAALETALGACAETASRARAGGKLLRERATATARDALRATLDEAARALESSTESEIEHKYLLRAFPPRAANVDPKDLAQGYLPGHRLHERLRRVRHDGTVKYIRTVKIGSGLARMEIEEETTEDVFAAMWPLTAGCRIHKERYAVKDGALTWTIDRFVDRDLVLAEVEVPSREIAPSPPEWLADYIVKDVTGDPAYVNLNLAR